MIESCKYLNLYLPQNENSLSAELALIGIPNVQLQSEQFLMGLFSKIETLLLQSTIYNKHKINKVEIPIFHIVDFIVEYSMLYTGWYS